MATDPDKPDALALLGAVPTMPQTKEERVRFCMALMPARWVKGDSSRELAKIWGCDLHLVEHAAAEAWRRVKASDAGWVREHLCAELEEALGRAKTITDLRDQIKGIVEVAKVWGPLAGAIQPGSVNIAVLNAITPHQALSIPSVLKLLGEIADFAAGPREQTLTRGELQDFLANLR